MKKIITYLLFLLTFSLVSCVTPQEEIKEKEYLVDGEDYIDVAQTYDGESVYYDDSKWYYNKLDKIPLPDPHVFYEDGTYYIIGTTDHNNDVTNCYTTEDFVTFTLHKAIYDPSLYDGWERDVDPDIYAPEMYEFDGVYYMYYSANDESGTRLNSVVSADNPLGPFKPIVNDKVDGLNNALLKPTPEANQPKRALDATIFVDDDGKMYMYYVVTSQLQYIVGVEMKSPYEPIWSTVKDLIKPGYVDSNFRYVELEWETYRNEKQKFIAEAPYMLKSNGKYYLTYSVNGCWDKHYNVCYAVSDTPLGNFVKPYEVGKMWTNLLMGYPGDNNPESEIYQQWNNFSSGSAHHCFFYIGNQLMIGYHAHKDKAWDSSDAYTERYFAMDYVYFDNEGVPFVNGPTYSPQPLPETLSNYKNIAPLAKVETDYALNIEYINDNYIVDCSNLVQEEGKEVGLESGITTITMTFDKEYYIGGIMVYVSGYYDMVFTEIDTIDFGNNNIIYYPQYCSDLFMDDSTQFVFPCSAFIIDIQKEFISNSVVITFDLPEEGQINEIVILGR